jgi:periplasmic divalent cation tolerance protein
MESEVYVAWTTVDSEDAAEALARELVEAGLAACAQVDAPGRSFYRWKEETHCDCEWRLWLKCSGERIGALEARVRERHPYEQPQWIAVRADRVDPGYAAWVRGA